MAVAQEGDERPEVDDGRPEFIIVDRPSFANGSAVVGNGVRSLESGVLVTRNRGSSDVLTQTPLLFRAGTADDLEAVVLKKNAQLVRTVLVLCRQGCVQGDDARHPEEG